ncbi:hypothetical protein VNO77_43922 [Canavalia gladiata]|uniref:VQ domain-containing protein n=1 Tax=Canavalia gladiata TaxID=3824 RepID=A0AAN9JVQ1_CANGL
MDSGNSGSMQSSSTAGEEEYDSRAESTISAFLNNNNLPPPPPPPPPTHVAPFTSHHHHHHHHMLDPLSNYLDPTQRSSSHPSPNLDMVWSRVARSEPNQPDLGAFIPCSSSSQNHQGAFLLTQLGEGETRGGVGADAGSGSGGGAFLTTHQHLSLPPETAVSRGGSVSATNEQANTNNNNNMVRNPKKRSRASRRAPTTVLTTDTNNFRAMVQEFTGIPAPPFTSSSPFPRTRLDLFATSSSSSATIRSASTHLDPPTTPSYLLRPFAQKLQPPPSSFPPIIDTLASNNSTHNSSNSTSVNYHHHHHSLNMQLHNNPILTFQSILPTPPKYPPLGNNNTNTNNNNNNNNSPVAASKTQQLSLEIPSTSVDSHLKMGVLEELGLRHAHVNTHVAAGANHHNMVPSSSDGTLSTLNNNTMRNPSLEWSQRISNNNDGGGVLRSLGVAATLNYRTNATASDFHGDKGPDCAVAAARSEGMVESWINCSSE